ncbi:hypothetical protein CEXT_183201 [Caerostris extrusa]|uniref:Uncharacterized protein n=1 Tax=Caerostris extrusa TaxID=172846 RepID=A0AAV4Y5I5_CAEEX|nr:hypothetical protein CEXT_183201 [Caerostris extrusa]
MPRFFRQNGVNKRKEAVKEEMDGPFCSRSSGPPQKMLMFPARADVFQSNRFVRRDGIASGDLSFLGLGFFFFDFRTHFAGSFDW